MIKKTCLSFVLIVLTISTYVNGEKEEFIQYDDPLTIVSLFLPDNLTILEAGAHYGEDTYHMKHKWPKSTIHAFEPFPHSFNQLEKATEGFDGVFCWPYALNNKAGQFPFYVVASNDGASSLLAPQEYTKEAYAGPCITVNAVNLDLWAKEYQIDHIDFMWLDMEGAELLVLQTAPKILKTVKVIFVETNFWLCRVGTAQYEDLKSFLKHNDFVEVRHWAGVGQGNAVFVKKKLVKSYLKEQKKKS